MTEGYEDGNYLVRVRAQVMIRDDSTGGWVPMGGGGLSNVSVRKRALSLLPQQPSPSVPPPSAHHHHPPTHHHHPPHLLGAPPATLDDHGTVVNTAAAKHEYLIFGKRISDQSVVLSCTIKKDFEYNRVMPTFHHWRTGDKKFGLTFLTAADARAFDKGVRTAVDELLDVWPLLDVWAPKLRGETPFNLGLAESSPLHKYNSDVGDDEVFMTLNLPVERGDSRSSSDSSSRGGAGCRPPPTPTGPPSEALPSPHPHHHIHRIQYTSRHTVSTEGGGALPEVDPQRRSCGPREGEGKHVSPVGGDGEPGENYSYVRLTPVHEYIYPVVVTEETKRAHRDLSADRKAISPVGVDTMAASRPPLPVKLGRKRERHKAGGGRGSGGGSGGRARCRHCNEAFSLGDNARGCCEYAPDPVRTGIDAVSCISCAQCMIYHCMADAEGEFARHPCDCGNGGGEGPGGGDGGGGAAGGDGCGRRWLGLALLSLLVPCLWCYPPLKGCHRCGVACGLCGGRHEASPSWPPLPPSTQAPCRLRAYPIGRRRKEPTQDVYPNNIYFSNCA